MYYPEGMKAQVSPEQWSKPYSILAPLRIRTRATGFKIISGDHYTTTVHALHYHCTLISMNTISLSRTVFEMFDFKVFGVWSWPLTSESHRGSKNVILFESPFMTSSLTSMDTISLSRNGFEIFDFKVLRFDRELWLLKVILDQKVIPFESPYMTSYLTSMTPYLYLVPLSKYLTSKFLGFDLDIRPLKVNKC